jgi:imidazolonepropionase
MKRLFYNIGTLINPSINGNMSELRYEYNVAMAVEDDIIIEIGKEDYLLEKYNFIELINLDNQLIMPSFIDAHTHPIFWKTREEEFEMRLKGMTYEKIAEQGGGIKNSARALRTISEDELFDISVDRVKSFLHYGTSIIEAKSGYGLTFKDEVKQLKVMKRLSEELSIELIPTFLGAHDIPDEHQNYPERYIDILTKEMIPYVAELKLAKYCDVFCEKSVFTVEQSERILQCAKDNGLQLRVHADELTANFGGAEMAARMGAVSADHLLEISEQGILDLKSKNVVPILLPGTAFFLKKKKYAPARKMIDSGLPVVLATDFNPGSSYTQNIQFILSLACLQMDMLPEEVVNAVTINAAKSLQLDQTHGSLDKGKKANFTTFSVPNYLHIIYNYATNHTENVVKDGKMVYSRREFYL